MKRVKFQEANKHIKHPAKLVMAIVKAKNGKFNPITLEWFMKTSIEPVMFAISIGHTRYSYSCLQQNRFFNLCFPSKEMKQAVIICGTKSGSEIDKLSFTDLEWFKGRLSQYPVIKNAVANFECRVISQVRSGDHTIYVGEVKYSWLDETKEKLLSSDLEL